MSRRNKIVAAVIVVPLGVWILGGYVVAAKVAAPRPSVIEHRDAIGGKAVEDVSVRTEDGLTLSAWLVRNAPDRAVIFLPGIGSNRQQFGRHADYYTELGYTLLMPDLRATGQSEGRVISIGWNERKDLMACFNYLRDAGYAHVGADGISLGAAAICYSLKELKDLAFIVLESSYDTIDHAFYNRLDLYHVPHFLVYPVRWFVAWKIGAGPEQMRPVDFMPYCTAPTLVLAGDSEGYLKVSETMDLFNGCASAKKRVHIFKGAHHENFLKRCPDEFKQEVGDFLTGVSGSWGSRPRG